MAWMRQPKIWGFPIADLHLDLTQWLWAPPGRVTIRPAWGADFARLEHVRHQNRNWLAPWEATLPARSKERLPGPYSFRKRLERQMGRSEALVMVVEVDGAVAGLVSLGAVQHGAMSLANLGYWIAEEWSGFGIMSVAVAAVIDLTVLQLGLHRIEVNVRPENQASLALCSRLGLRPEGLRRRYMNINGMWRDHQSFAVDREMLHAGGLLETRFRNTPTGPPS